MPGDILLSEDCVAQGRCVDRAEFPQWSVDIHDNRQYEIVCEFDRASIGCTDRERKSPSPPVAATRPGKSAGAGNAIKMPEDYPALDDATRRTLTEFFDPYNQQLYRLIDEDFAWN